MATMILRFVIAYSITFSGNSRSSLVGQNKGLLGNAFMQERAVQVSTSSYLAFSLPLRDDL